MKKRGRKGQITIFIIVGVLVLLIAGIIIFYASQKPVEKLAAEEVLPAQPGAVRLFVESCLENTAEEAIQFNFLTGGFYLPELITVYDDFTFPYYFYLGEDVHPSKEEIEQGLSEYIKDNIDTCLNNFQAFEGARITQGKKTVSITIQENSVPITLKMPLQMKTGEQIAELENFEVTLRVPLKQVVDIINERMTIQRSQPNEVMLTDLIDNAAFSQCPPF